MAIRWIDAGRVSHYRSQSIYHGLGYALTQNTPETVVVAIPEDPYVCIGYFQDAAKEVDLDFCRQQNYPVIKRETGGGTVFIDSGQLFVQWVCQPGFLPRKVEHRFQLFNKAIIETYKFFGIKAYHYPINDVHVDGKKIVGTGAATIGEAEVVTGNFLYDFNPEIMTQVLNLPNATFKKAIGESLNNYMTWIKRELNDPPSYATIVATYKKKCEQVIGSKLLTGEFTAAELKAIEKAEAKLRQGDGLNTVGKSSTQHKNRVVKIHAGVWAGWFNYQANGFSMEVQTQMRDNALESIRFYPADSKDHKELKLNGLEKVLINAPMKAEEIKSRIEQFLEQGTQADTLLSADEWTNVVMLLKQEVDKMTGHG